MKATLRQAQGPQARQAQGPQARQAQGPLYSKMLKTGAVPELVEGRTQGEVEGRTLLYASLKSLVKKPFIAVGWRLFHPMEY